jgi:uncharacterized phiE125 gp8 family phage protein
LSPAAAGNVDNGVHRYLVTFVTATGETQAGTTSAAVTVVDKAINGKVSLTAIPLGGSSVTARKLYRTAAGGSVWMLLATISNNTATTYTDNIADASLGAGAPSTNTTGDAGLAMIIAQARQQAETALHRYLVTQTLDAYFDEFPGACGKTEAGKHAIPNAFRLPPLQSVAEITYVDADGVTQTLATDQYVVDPHSKPAQIDLAYGCSWPSTRAQRNAVKVRFVAGYGSADVVPACIKQWMLLRIGTMWANRAEMQADGRNMIAMPSQFVDCLLDGERIWGGP